MLIYTRSCVQVAYPSLESAGYITHRFWLGSCATRMKKRVHRPSHAEARRRKRKLLRTSSKCAAHNDHQKGACLPPTFGANGFVLADFLTPDGSDAEVLYIYIGIIDRTGGARSFLDREAPDP